MVKKIWKIAQYVILAMEVLVMIIAIFLGDLRVVFRSLLFISFWGSMILEEKLPNKNKAVSIIYGVSSVIMVFFMIVYVLFGFKL